MSAMVYALEITAVVEGVEQTHYFSTAPFATGPNDQPAHQPFAPLIRNAGTFARSLFSGKRMTGYVAPSYGSIELANPTDADGVGRLDDWATYGVSGARVVLRMGEIGSAYPEDWTLVYIARAQKVSVQPDGMTVSLRDLSQFLDKPVVSDVFTGSGGLEGSGAGLGRKKQFVSSDPGFIPPILIDAARQIYFVQSTGTYGIETVDSHPETPVFGVWDNGIPLTRTWPNYASSDELLGTAPAAGNVRYYFAGTVASGYASGPVFIRLGSPPDGDIRVFTIGAPGPDEWERIGQTFGSYSLGVMAIRAGVPAAQVDLDGVAMGAQLIEADQTYLQAMSNACMVSAGYFGFGRDETFRSGYLLDPEDEGFYYGVSLPSLPAQPAQPTTSLATFTQANSRGLRSDPPAGADAPTWCVTISTGRAWPSRIAGGASATLKGWLTREPYYDSFKGYSDSTLAAHPQAERAEVVAPSRDLQNSFSRQLAAARYLYLYGGTPRTYTFTAPLTAENLALDLHDVVTLQTPRFSMSAGVKFRIVGIVIDAQARQISFTVWAPGRGVYSGSTSALDPGTEAWAQAQATASQLSSLMRAVMPNFVLYSSGTKGSAVGGGGPIYMPNFTLLSSGSPQIVPEHNPALLLRFDGTNGSTAFVDSSAYAHAITAVGNAQHSTANGNFSGSTGLFDGSGDYLSIADSDVFDMGAGAFTVEAEVDLDGTSEMTLISKLSSTAGLSYEWTVAVRSDAMVFYHGIRGTNQSVLRLFFPSAISPGTKYHVALVREASGDWHCYLDGVQGTDYQFAPLAVSLTFGSVTTGVFNDSIDLGDTSNPIEVGGNSLGVWQFSGDMKYLRFATSAIYTSNFTPPTSL